MSVKFEETVKKAQDVMSGAEGGRIPGTSGDHPIAARVGTALTGGRQNAGTKGYLAVSTSKSPFFQAYEQLAHVFMDGS